MSSISLIFYCAECVCAVITVIAALKSEKPVKKLLFSLFSGVAALLAVNATGIFTSVSIGINEYTVCISALGGVPGVIMLLIMRLLCL